MAHQALYSLGTIAWSSALVKVCKVPSSADENVKTRGAETFNPQPFKELAPSNPSSPVGIQDQGVHFYKLYPQRSACTFY